MTTLLDTGPVVAAARRDDADHERCVEFFADAPRPLLLPSTVLIESCWLLNVRVGPAAHAMFLRRVHDDIEARALTLVELASADLRRMAELAETYHDLGLDPPDASVIALAERLGVRRIATLDHRDFRVVRPRHGPLTLLP